MTQILPRRCDINVSKFALGPTYEGKCTGTVSCFALSKASLRVMDGNVTFFSQPGTKAEGMVISYFLQLLSLEGTRYCLRGHKYIDSNICFSPSKTWEAVTALNVTVTRIDGSNVGAGVLRISWRYFLRQMRKLNSTVEVRISHSFSKTVKGRIQYRFHFRKMVRSTFCRGSQDQFIAFQSQGQLIAVMRHDKIRRSTLDSPAIGIRTHN